MNVRFELEQGLSPICNAIQGWGSDPQSSPETLAREIADWRRTAVHPALVSNVFVYMLGPGNIIPRFAQLEPKYNQFIKAEWPANFLALQAKLNEIADQAWTQEHSAPVPAWLLDEDVPALVYAAHSAQASAPEAFVIVELNTDELAHHILPELAQRYLGSNGHLDYQVALINQNIQRNVVYTSDSGFGSDSSAIDAQLNVFGPPMPNHGEPGGTMSHTAQAPEPGPEYREPPHHDFRLPPGTHPDEAGHREAPFRLQAIRYSPDDRGWTLIARHRKGSVEAAVASLYHRNLAVSFGVLLVLAGTIALVVMTAQRSRRLAQLKMDFVASVSHELRTPLTGIVMAAQNAADGLVETKDRAMLYGRAILGQAQQLSELIEQILLFPATEKGRHQFHFQWVDISEVIESALDGSASLIRSAQAQVQHTIQPDLPPISSDYKALTQSVQNLLANAIKYGGEDRWLWTSLGNWQATSLTFLTTLRRGSRILKGEKKANPLGFAFRQTSPDLSLPQGFHVHACDHCQPSFVCNWSGIRSGSCREKIRCTQAHSSIRTSGWHTSGIAARGTPLAGDDFERDSRTRFFDRRYSARVFDGGIRSAFLRKNQCAVSHISGSHAARRILRSDRRQRQF